MNDRLYRSRDDRVFAGVCGGIAEYFDVDPSLVRILYALVALLSGFFPLLILYIVMVIIVPEEPVPGTMPPGPGWGPGGNWGAGSPWGQPWAGPGAPPAGTTGGPEGTGGSPSEGSPAAEGAGAGQASTPGAGPAGAPGWGAAPGGQGYVDWRAQRAAWRAQRREMRAAWRAQRHGYGTSTGAIVIGLLLVIIGAWFFLQQAIPSLDAGWFWPVILILGGVMLLAGSLRTGGPSQG